MQRTTLLLLLAAAGQALAVSPSCLGPESLFRMRGVSEPQISPDGAAVVYVYSWLEEMEDTGYSHLREVRGSVTRTLHEGKIHERSPRFSPDGKWLAYLSDRDGKTRLWLRPTAGGPERTLDLGGHAAGNLTWSPDSKSLAFSSFVATEPAWNPPVPKPPAGAKWATPPSIITTMRYSMDGSGVTRPGSIRLFTISIQGGEIRQVSREPYWHTTYLGPPELTWSADSKALLAPAVKGPDGWAIYDESNLYSFPLDGGEPRRLGPAKWYQSHAAPSPDGSKIAYSGFAWKGQSYHVPQLWVAGAGGENARSLTPKFDRDPTALQWNPNGQSLYFLADSEGDTNLYTVDLAGSVRNVTRGHQRISSYVMAKNGRTVALLSTPTQPGALVEISLQDGSVRTLFDPNQQFLRTCPLTSPEEIRYKASDGRSIHGWLLKPPAFDASKKYPLLVSIHGGPHASYGNSFQQDLQIYAAHGYVVLYTNPRGSTGYGEEFARIIQHRWPGDDVQDVLSGVDHVLRGGFIDAQRMGVIGGSGGGLMTSWVVTQTDRFRAAVAWWPVTNWITHVGSGDNGYYIASVYRKGMPWDHLDDYVKHSPLFQVNRVKTPTMIMCGDEDWRVPIAQSQEFYRALKVRGVDTVFLRYPGEAHGVLKKPSHRVSVLAHSLAWLDRYTGTQTASGGSR